MDPIEVLLVYAPADRQFVPLFEKQLSVLSKQGEIVIWHEGIATIGDDLPGQFVQHLKNSKLIIPLLSADLIASDLYEDVLMPILSNAKTLVFPILLRAFDITHTIFSNILYAPDNHIPIANWDNLDNAWHSVVRSIRLMLDEMRSRKIDSSADVASSANRELKKSSLRSSIDKFKRAMRDTGDMDAARSSIDEYKKTIRDIRNTDIDANSGFFIISNLSNGERIGHYELQDKIGLGGSGVVYRAIDLRNQKIVCLKILYPLTQANILLSRILERMKSALDSINHRGIAKILEFSPILINGKSTFYISMNLIEGKTLEQWACEVECDSLGSLRRLSIFRDIASVLHLVHTCKYKDNIGFENIGILHGDIKPANIMIQARDIPVILDFLMLDLQRWLDLSEMPQSAFASAVLAINTSFYGTAGFMSPEQESEGIVTVQSDIYSLGCTILRTFVPQSTPGKHPYGDAQFLLWQLALPEELKELVGSMISNDPADRPSSMSIVAKKISGIIERHINT